MYFTQPTVKDTVHQQTAKMLVNIDHMSKKILDKEKIPEAIQKKESFFSSFSGFNPVFIDNRRESNWFSSKTTTVINNNHYHGTSARQVQEENKKNDDFLIRIISFIGGAVVLGAGAYLFGQQKAQHTSLKKEMRILEGQKEKFYKNIIKREYRGFDLYVNRVTKITQQADAVLERLNSNKMKNIALTVGMIAAGAFAITGSLIASMALIQTGVAIGCATGALALIKLGFDHFDTSNIDDAKDIQRRLGKLNQPKNTLAQVIPQQEMNLMHHYNQNYYADPLNTTASAPEIDETFNQPYYFKA